MSGNQSENSIALLIDADNAPSSKIDFILGELAELGRVSIRRAYGNWKKPSLAGWERELSEYGIQPMQQFDIVKGKNATDMALVIDAMDILYSKYVDTFVLVSSDCDFTPLVLRLREEGKQVIGFGRMTTPKPFVNACSKFLYVDDSGKVKEEAGAAQELKQNTKLMNCLRNAISAHCDDNGWAALGPIGSHMSNNSSIDHRTFGYKKLSDLFAAIDFFTVKKIKGEQNTVYKVKVKKAGAKKKSAKKAAKKSSEQ